MAQKIKQYLVALSPEEKRKFFAQLLREKNNKLNFSLLSFAQTRLWFVEQLEPGISTYNIPVAYRLTGLLNIGTLEQSFNEIIKRHEILRTTFLSVDGHPIQAIASAITLTLPVTDLQDHPEREVFAQQIATQEAQHPFNLATEPLFRVKLLRLTGAEHMLLLNMHHIVSDGWSFDVFFQELAALYTAFSTDKPSPLPELPIQYADFAHWQREWLSGEVLESQLNYWKQQLSSNLPILQLPTDSPRPPVQTYPGAYQSLELSKNLTEALKALSQQERVTLFMTLLAAFQTLLSRYSGQEDIIVGTPIAGRNQAETEQLIGFFVNTLAIRTNLSNNPSFRQLLSRVREVTLGAYDNQDLPLEKLIEELNPERDLSRSPLFQVMFGFQNTPKTPWELPGLTITPLEVHSGTSKFDLTLDLKETSEGIKGGIEYNTDLFEATTITRMLGHFQTLLESIVANPDQHLSDLPLLTPTEQHQLLVEWNNTTTNYPNHTCIHQLFEAQVERTPNAIAAIFENQQLTYLKLNAKANQLAHHLQKLGVKPEVLVGICVERSLDLLVAVLGILKAGGAYVPLDPAYPQERLNFMLEDAQIPILLTQKPLLNKFPKHKAHVICLDRDREEINRENEQNPTSSVTANNLAYVIYTSGSTGQPKGVQVLHRAVVNLLNSMGEQPGLTNQDILLSVTSLSFDIAVLELFLPIIVGARVVLVSREIASDGLKLSACLVNSGATVMQATPATWQLLLEAGWGGSNTLKILCGGEALPRTLANQLLKRGASLWNLYGPTETTIWSAVCKIESEEGAVSIGQPIANTQIYLLDSHCQPVPIGIFGELHIGGVGLARGYLNLPNLTTEKFIPNPFSNKAGDRLYKTGDLARYLPNGNIEFVGRIDNQVKIRGFRIELGEIEAVLAQHPAVQQAVVTTKENVPNDKRLVAYIILNQEQPSTTDELRCFLAQKLPNYMVPRAFVFLEALPLTPNGKIDRRALPTSDQVRQELEETLVPPRDDLEVRLTRIWEQVLSIQSIGVRDNFFDLGGHSLLAVRLVDEIKKAFSNDLPLIALFQAPTIEQLAKVLRQERWSVSWFSLVPIQPNGSKPPVFGIHVLGEGFIYYRSLANHLGSDQPLYGLHYGLAAQTTEKKQVPPSRIEDLAAHYIEEMQTLQPQGPYFLAGISAAGIITFEMAQQLHAQGQKLALLAFIDCFAPGYPKLLPNSTRVERCVLHWIQRLQMHLSNLLLLEPKNRLTYLIERLKNFTTVVNTGNYIVPIKEMVSDFYLSMSNLWPHSIRDMPTVEQETKESYKPQVYPGKITLFRASKQPSGCYKDPELGWSGLADGGIEIYEISSDHSSIVVEPRVRFLAEKLRDCIDKALEDVLESHSAEPKKSTTEVKHQTNFLNQERWSALQSSLVPIQPGGCKPPLFLCEGASIYRCLIPHLDPEQPLYGLIAETGQGKPLQFNRLEDLAAHYIEAARTLQPEGPYFLGGVSWGGVVAFEMAQQLRAQGQKVALLAFFDTIKPGASRPLPIHKRASVHLSQLLQVGPSYLAEKVIARIQKFEEKVSKIYGKLALENGFFISKNLEHLVQRETYNQAVTNYVPQIYPGRVTLFVATNRLGSGTFYVEPGLGWTELAAGGLEIHEVPSSHLGMLQEPHVQVLAEKLKACIDRVQVDDLAHIPLQHSDPFVCDRENSEV